MIKYGFIKNNCVLIIIVGTTLVLFVMVNLDITIRETQIFFYEIETMYLPFLYFLCNYSQINC